ncbi:MAG TPA: hypothetical protein VFS43_18380, partial [Polyangiaceae bacterium]|nr:hypothetical protein [Polyangiaceae bacterium]
FADLLVEHTGYGAEGEADVASRLFLVPAGAAGPAAFETESFSRGCRPTNAAAVHPAATPCTGGAADWYRAGSPTKVPAPWVPAGQGPGPAPSARATPAATPSPSRP